MSIELSELDILACQVGNLFAFSSSSDALLAPLRTLIAKTTPPFVESAEAFCSSLGSVVSTAGLPFMLALTAAHNRRHQLLHCAAELEELDGLKAGTEAWTKGEGVAKIRAETDMQELVKTKTGRDSLNYEACSILLDLSKDGKIVDAARQLTFQGTVLTWSAFEVLSREVFRAHLNRTPKAYAKLLGDPDIRKRFDLSRVSIERVAEFDFDLSSKVGDLLIEQNDLADLAGIKSVFFALFPHDVSLHKALNERDLWLLFQRRSLIVHRCGIVDRRYVEVSGDQQPVSHPLELDPRELKGYLQLVAAGAHALISAAVGLPTGTRE